MLKNVPRAGLAIGSVAFALMFAAHAALAEDETKEVWRLFVTDQEKAEITVVDPAQGSVVDRFSTKGYVTHLVPSESGETLFAVQMDHDVVHVVASGISLGAHGDHSDIATKDAQLLPVELTGARPVHAVMHGHEIVQFYDRDGEGRVFDEDALLSGDATYTAVKGAAPHHGVIVPMGDYFLASEPNLEIEIKEGELPPRLGVKALGKNGQPVGETATCTGLHGEAHSAGLVAFGCDEGVVIAQSDGGEKPTFEMLAYGDDMPEGRVGQLAGGKAMQFFLGNYGADKLVIIEPSSKDPYRVVSLPVRLVDFVLDPVDVKMAYVFTEDGKINVLNVLSGDIIRSLQITEPYSKDGHWRDPRPRLAMMGDTIAVTDPREGLIRRVDIRRFTEVESISVGGLPFNIAAVGGSGLQH